MLFGLLQVAGIHMVPNMIMKGIKKTKVGHKFLTSTFTTGIELGSQGKKLHNNIEDVMKYGFGPESLVEYQIGLKFGMSLRDKNEEEKTVAIQEFKLEILRNVGDLNKQQLEDLEETPMLSTLYQFAKGNDSKLIINLLSKGAVDYRKKRNILNILTNTGLLILAGVLDVFLLFQPVICEIRRRVGTSEYGKKILSNNFDKGADGKIYSKPFRLVVDLVVAPSVLDTMRIGNTAYKNGYGLVAKLSKGKVMENI